MIGWYEANLVLIEATFLNFLLALSIQVPLRLGVFSFAGVGSYGLGAYTAAILTLRYDVPAFVAIGAAVLLAAVVGYLFSLLVARLNGLYLAMATIAFVLIIAVLATNGGELTGGANGLPGVPGLAILGLTVPRGWPLLLATWGIVAVAGLIAWRLAAGRLRLTWHVAREDELAAQTIGLDPNSITWQAPGLNHNIWLTHFIADGKDAYPLIDEWIETKAEEYWRTHVATRTHDIQMSRGAVHQYHLYGKFPIGDTVRRGGWWYHNSLESKKYWFGEPWGGPDTELARPLFVKNLEERIAQMTRLANDPKASMIEAFGAQKTREQQVPIIDGLVNNNEGYFQVNVPNKGALPGIPDDVVVEVPAIVNQKGIQPIRVDPLPAKIMLEHVLPEWLDMERELLAYKTGDRSMLLWDVLESHQTKSYQQAVEVLDELLKMEGHEEMAEHYRFPKNWLG